MLLPHFKLTVQEPFWDESQADTLTACATSVVGPTGARLVVLAAVAAVV